MHQPMRLFLIIGLAGTLAAARAETNSGVTWPAEWRVFGPVPPVAGAPVPDGAVGHAAQPGLARNPAVLELGGTRYAGRAVTPDADGRMDLGALFGGVPRGAAALLMAPIKAERAVTIRMGAGADWWMQWWLDGKPVYDTLAGGNRQLVISPSDHVFELALTRGEHVLSAAVFAGKSGMVLAVAGPGDVAPKPISAASHVPGVTWPAEWTVFGPGASIAFRRTPDRAKLLPGAALKTIPAELEIGGKTFPARTVRPENGQIDLVKQVGVRAACQPVYFLAPVRADADTTVTIGAGAGGWMQWWLDGEPVYDTLWGGGSSQKHVSGTDNVFDLALTRGDHVLAVTVVSGHMGSWSFAVASPGEWLAQPSAFNILMVAGQRQYVSMQWSYPINFPVAFGLFRRAWAAAATDRHKANAGLAAADNRLHDFTRETDYPAIRADYEAVLALQGIGPREQARALLGIGETFLRERQYDRAREQFAQAGERGGDPGWAAESQFAAAKSYLQQRRYEDARAAFERLASMDGVDPQRGLGWEARALLEAIRLRPLIRAGHPRLFFNEETWPAVKAQALGPEKDRLEEMKKWVLNVERDPIRGSDLDWGKRAMDAAFVYRVTGDPAVFERVRAMLRTSVDYYGSRQEFNAGVQSRLAAMAALDWVWNDLPPAEREALARDLIRYVYSMYVEDRIRNKLQTRRTQAGETGGGFDYYERKIPWFAAVATLHDWADDLDQARGLAILGWGYLTCLEEITDKLERRGDDGAVRSALEYYFAASLNPLWPFLYSLQSAASTAVDSRMAGVFSPDYVLRNTLDVVPHYIRHFGYCRSWRKNGGLMFADPLYDHLGHYINLFGATYPGEAAIAGHLRRRMQETGISDAGEYSVYPFLVSPEGAPELGIPPGMPLARHFEYLGQILMSSGFGPDDAYALFSCGGNRNEADFDATHFTIYRQGYLALDSGTRAQDQPSPVSGNNYTHQTVAHNGVLIHMPGETLVDLGGNPVQANSGGQRKKPFFAKLLAFETDAALFAYMATDATPTYHTNKCAEMMRQVLFLPPGHFVVFDRVASKKAEYAKTWLLHTANEPRIAGKEFRADQDRGRLYCRTLYPPDAVLEPVGGPGREFWADGKNWPIPENSPYLESIGMTNGMVPENIGRWRVEVKPGASREQDWFLHLIQTTDQTAEAMTPSRVNDTGAVLEISFTAGARSYGITLNKRGEVGGHIRIAEGSEVLADRPLTRAVQPQAGLALVKESGDRSQNK